MVREMQRNRQLHYTPIGFVDDDPRKRGARIVDVRVLGTTDDLAHLLRDNKPDEVLIAIPSAAGRGAAPDRRDVPRRGRPREDAAGPARADLRRPQPRGPDPPGAGRGRPRPPAGRGRPAGRRGVRPRQDRARHGRRAARSAPSSAASSRGSASRGSCSSTRASRRCSRSSASSSTSATSRRRSPCSPTAGDRAEDAPGLRAVPAAGRLPRRRVQARRDARGEPAAGRLEQRARDARARRGRGRVRRSSGSSSSRPTRPRTRRT